MLAFLEGNIVSKRAGQAVIDVNGVGYLLHMAQASLASLPASDEKVRVLCTMTVSDAGVFLYGFISEEEREMFEMLTSVSGVGPKMALAALSSYDVVSMQALIVRQDIKALSKIPGIGKKTASRIALELKDSFDLDPDSPMASPTPSEVDAAFAPVSEALASMGFTTAEISMALEGADADASESEMLQYALRRMA